MLIKITLALALALAGLATVASYNNNATPIASLASGGGNLVPVWWPLVADAIVLRQDEDPESMVMTRAAHRALWQVAAGSVQRPVAAPPDAISDQAAFRLQGRQARPETRLGW
jgi:hypothetical protein